MNMIIRPARKKDLPSIRKILQPWTDEEPEVLSVLEDLVNGDSHSQGGCTVLASERSLLCVSLWTFESSDSVRLWSLGLTPSTAESGTDIKFLREVILDWSEMGIARAVVQLPKSLAPSFIGCLRGCGFISEGISASCALDSSPRFRLTKYFLYRTIPHDEVMEFLKEFLLSLGYEVRQEGEGFGYRVRAEYRLPFMFNAWHRITRSGPEIIVHPPARVLEMHELETLFYPLRVETAKERALFLPMEKKRATNLIELPEVDIHQDSLFHDGLSQEYRPVFLNNLTYGFPGGLKRVRRGLPLVFYVNRLGVVGSGRVEDWYVDEPKNLYNQLEEMGYYDPEDVKEHCAASGPMAGKVLVIRFHWYRRLHRPVTLEQLRKLEATLIPSEPAPFQPTCSSPYYAPARTRSSAFGIMGTEEMRTDTSRTTSPRTDRTGHSLKKPVSGRRAAVHVKRAEHA